MARGRHRLSTPVRLMVAVATLLTAGGIVTATGTAAARSNAESRVGADEASCRPEQQIAMDALQERLRAQPETARQVIGQPIVSLLGEDIAAPSRSFCTVADILANNENRGGRGGRDGRDGRGDRGDRGDGKKEDDKKKDDEKKDNEKKDDEKKDDEQAAAEQFPGRDKAGGPARRDFVRIQNVAPNADQADPGPNASTGSFTSPCGTNAEGHRNSDNFMVAPGKRNGAQHVHDYVGNLSTDANSTDESLHKAGTSCTNGDRSTYFWPVLRDTRKRGDDVKADGGGLDGNFGQILRPVSADLAFRGNPTGKVTAMPDDLQMIMGDAKAGTNGGANARPAWTCTGFEDRTTAQYPLCPQGSQIKRILDFPSCWDGKNLDSENHRTHVLFPQQDGSCSAGTVLIPQLRITLTYDQPAGRGFALDTFPDQRHNPVTDHADFMDIMSGELLTQMADCINSGRTC